MTSNVIPLTNLSVPDIFSSQIKNFTFSSIKARRQFEFDPSVTHQLLTHHRGEKVLGIDLGGNKAVTYLFEVRDNELVLSDNFSDYTEGEDGEGFLASFEKVADFANKNHLPVGISYGAPVVDTKPDRKWPKFKKLIDELADKYDGNFANLFTGHIKVLNDATAGLISGSVECSTAYKSKDILYVINGSGMNAAALKDGQIIATEAGHVATADKLNLYAQKEPCGVNGATYTCVQSLGANKYGIESIWQQKTGDKLSAKQIEDKYKAGDPFAREIYDYSAWVVAHMIIGVATVTKINLALPTSAVVAHGGAFRFPNYKERIQQIADKYYDSEIKMVKTEDYTKNACAEGAAIAALIN